MSGKLLISDIGFIKEYEATDYISKPLLQSISMNVNNSINVNEYENMIIFDLNMEENGEILLDNETDLVIMGSEMDIESYPLGTILIYPSLYNKPNNWLICDGKKIYKKHYSELWYLFGDKYSLGDNDIEIEKFRLPDLRGRVIYGKDENDNDFNTIGKTGGSNSHTLTYDELFSHNHGRLNQDAGYRGASPQSWDPYSLNYDGINYYSTYTGGSQPYSTLPPYVVVNFVIKAKP